MSARLEDEHDDKTEDDEQEEEYTRSPASILLVPGERVGGNTLQSVGCPRARGVRDLCMIYAPRRRVQLLDGFIHLHGRLFDVVFNAVEEGPLINDHRRQVFE